jgi:PPM family protein phosphatase
MPGSFSHLSVGAVTDVGVRRKNNEDAIIALPQHGVFCVADGMGGAQGGEVASQAAVTCLKNAFDGLASPDAVASAAGKARIIDRALNEASHWIKRRSDKKGIKGAGTTAVVLAFDGRHPDKGMVVHAGDSRAYRFREDALVQLSRDHTVAEAAGIKDDSKLPSMFKGVVTRAVGVNAKVELEVTPTDVKVGDVFLLASDGLDKLVPDEDIAGFLREGRGGDLQALAQQLVDVTNKRGGVDNVSVVLVRVGEVDPATLVGGTDEDDDLGPEPITGGGDDDEPSTQDELELSAQRASDAGDLECHTPGGDSRTGAGKPAKRTTDEHDLPPAEKRPALGDFLDAHRGKILVGLGILFVMVVWHQVRQLQRGPSGPRGFVEGLEEFTGDGEEEVLTRRRQPLPIVEPEVDDPEAALRALERSLTGGGEESGAESGAVREEVLPAESPEVLPAEGSPDGEEAVAQEMESAGVARFDRAVGDVRRLLREAESAAGTDPMILEQALAVWEELAAGGFEGVEPDRRRLVEAELKSELLNAGSAYLAAERARILARLESGEEPGDAAVALEAFPGRAPVLAGMLQDTYQEARDAVDHARQTRQGKAMFAQTLQRFDELLPERIADGASLEAAESAARVLADARARSWDGVSDEERTRHLDLRAAGLQAIALAYIEGRRDQAHARYAAGEDGEAGLEALREMPGRAPALTELVAAPRAEAEAAVAAVAERFQGVADFQAVFGRIRAAAPDAIAGMSDLARAEAAASSLSSLDGREWAGVTAEEVAAAREQIREPLAALVAGFVDGLREQAVDAYGRGDEAEALHRRLASLRDRAPHAVALAPDALDTALAEVDKARSAKRAADAARAEEQARLAAEAAARAAAMEAENAAEAAAEARASFPDRVREALEGGGWGRFGAWMDPWADDLGTLAAASGHAEGIAAWRRTWQEARDDPAHATAALQEAWDAAASVCRNAGVPPPPTPPALPEDPAARADAYCAARYRLQQHLTAPLDSAAALRDLLAAWGDKPESVLTTLMTLSGREADTAAAGALGAPLTTAAAALRAASADDAALSVPFGPVTIESLQQTPLAAVAQAERACDQAWNRLYDLASGPLLDQIDRGLVYGGFMGMDLNQDDKALQAVKGLEDAVFDLIEARAALPQDAIEAWWRQLDRDLLRTVIARLRDLDGLRP